MSNIKIPEDIKHLFKWTLDRNNTNANGLVLTNDKEEISVICTGYYNHGLVLRSFKKYRVTQAEMEEFARLYVIQDTFDAELASILSEDDK